MSAGIRNLIERPRAHVVRRVERRVRHGPEVCGEQVKERRHTEPGNEGPAGRKSPLPSRKAVVAAPTSAWRGVFEVRGAGRNSFGSSFCPWPRNGARASITVRATPGHASTPRMSIYLATARSELSSAATIS